jgi:MFS family permease
MANRIHFAFMCAGHLYGHLFMLVFSTVAALSLSKEWGMSYAELIPYATPGFIALGVCAVPAGWLADKWSRKGMMVLFFIGIGLSSIYASLAETPLNMSVGHVFAIIFISTAIGGLIFQSTTFALPKIFDERLSELAISATVVGWYAFIVFAFAAVGQLIVGYMLDRYPIHIVFSIVAALQAVFFGIMPGLSGLSALVVAIAFMLVVFGQIPINDVLISRVTQSEYRSRAYAFRYIVTFSVSAFSLPFIAWIHSRWGFDRLFIVLSVAAIFIFVTVLLLPRALSGKR